MMLSDICLSDCLSVCLTSVAYIGPKSRTERPRKTKIGTEVAHITCDSDTTVKVKRLKVKVTGGGGILWRPPAYSLLPAGLLRSGKLPVLFLLSSQKSTFCPLAEKL